MSGYLIAARLWFLRTNLIEQLVVTFKVATALANLSRFIVIDKIFRPGHYRANLFTQRIAFREQFLNSSFIPFYQPLGSSLVLTDDRAIERKTAHPHPLQSLPAMHEGDLRTGLIDKI